ncbi:Hypothetical predicted protein, partial [Paramuricea clavata]
MVCFHSDPTLSALVYTPNDMLQDTCANFASCYAFSELNGEEEKEDEDENTENEVEDLNNKRVVLAGLCKLFSYGIFEMRLATVLFSRIISAFGNFGDLIKQTMSKCREININYYTKTIALTLFSEYEKLREVGNGPVDKSSEEYTALKELARRLALTYGIELTKEPIRKAMINLHREAILRSFSRDDEQENEQDNAETEIALPNIGFLAVISECSSRLISQDKKTVLGILKKQMEDIKLNIKDAGRDPELQPLVSYYRVMLEGSQLSSAKTTKLRPAPQKAKRKLDVD